MVGHRGSGGSSERLRRAFEDSRSGPIGVLASGTALMLDCVWKDGRRLALPYGYITLVRWFEGSVVAVDSPDLELLIEGRNLGALYNNLCAHRLYRVQEGGMATGLGVGGDMSGGTPGGAGARESDLAVLRLTARPRRE